jgi:hypothetical protein
LSIRINSSGNVPANTSRTPSRSEGPLSADTTMMLTAGAGAGEEGEFTGASMREPTETV